MTIVDSQGVYGKKPLWGTKRRRLEKAGKAFRIACRSDFWGPRKKGRRAGRTSHSAAQLYKASARTIKGLKEEVTHKESCPLQEWVCQKEDSEGSSGTLRNSVQQIQVVCLHGSRAAPILLAQIYHIFNLLTIVERPIHIVSVMLKYRDGKRRIKKY